MPDIDTIQEVASGPLEPFILLLKSATSPRAAVEVIKQATSAPNVFTFAELLETPTVQALRSAEPEYSAHYTLLEIFTWGTWADYSAHSPPLPPLSPAQSSKLRQLSLLTPSLDPHSLTYPSLLTTLSLPTTRDLEDTVIAAIGNNLLTATLNPSAQSVDITSVSPVRDPPPGAQAHMVQLLEEWDGRCTDLLEELDEKVKEIRNGARERRKRDVALERKVKTLTGTVETAAASQGARGGGMSIAGMVSGAGKRGMVGEADEMDVDERSGGGVLSARKRGGKMAIGGRRLGGD